MQRGCLEISREMIMTGLPSRKTRYNNAHHKDPLCVGQRRNGVVLMREISLWRPCQTFSMHSNKGTITLASRKSYLRKLSYKNDNDISSLGGPGRVVAIGLSACSLSSDVHGE